MKDLHEFIDDFDDYVENNNPKVVVEGVEFSPVEILKIEDSTYFNCLEQWLKEQK